MRPLLVALGLVASLSQACAQEFELPTLRGSEFPIAPVGVAVGGWNGIYFGAQAGYSQAHYDFTPLNGSFGTRDASAASYGAFIGYNSQWEGLVLGIEGNYSHSNLSGSALYSSPPLAGINSIDIKNYGTLRGRAGFILYDCFLPYFMLGAAVGHVDMMWAQSITNATPPVNTAASGGNVVWGFSAGAGIDIALSPRFFLRAEYEYVQFAHRWVGVSVPNFSQIVGCYSNSCLIPHINTLRAAIGVKF